MSATMLSGWVSETAVSLSLLSERLSRGAEARGIGGITRDTEIDL